MNGYDFLALEILKQAANDNVRGFKALYKTYGNAFLKEGFAVEIPRRKGTITPSYAVVSTGKRLSVNQCLYFDTVDYFFSEDFAALFSGDPEIFLLKLQKKAMEELRAECAKREIPFPPKNHAA